MNTLEKCKQSETYKDWIDTDNVIAERAIDEGTVIVITQKVVTRINQNKTVYTKTRLFLIGEKWQVSVDKLGQALTTTMQDLLDNYSA